MKKLVRPELLIAALLAIMHSSASAVPLVLHDTGEGLAQGNMDLNWTVALNAGAAVNATSAVDPNSQWHTPAAGDTWISTVGSGSIAAGLYTYTTTFTIGSGFNPATAQISGNWWADEPNSNNGIYLNGNLVSSFGGAIWSEPNPANAAFSITSGFVTGVNTLSFRVQNTGGPGGTLIQNLAGSVSVPDGGMTLSMLGMALAGLGMLRRKR